MTEQQRELYIENQIRMNAIVERWRRIKKIQTKMVINGMFIDRALKKYRERLSNEMK